MINPQCKVCQFIEREGDILDWSMTNAALSLIVDCSKDSIRRHRLHSEDGELVVSSEEVGDAQWIPRRKWMSPSGEIMYSYQNANMDRSQEDVEAHLDNDRIDGLIMNWPEPSVKDFKGGTELALPADLQLGKAGEAGGGTPETIQRFYDSIEAVAERWAHLSPKHAYLCDLGDLVDNLFSTPQQQGTNDRTLPEQIEDAVAVYMNALGRLRPLVGELTFATVTSNHGEARVAQKVNPYGSENDWGLMIQRVIQGKCEDRGWDIKFLRPDLNEDTCVFTTPDGTRVALNHGHHSGSPARVKTWVTNQIVGRRPGWDAHIHALGHYHHPYFFPVGDGRTVFGTPALDGGSAWFTRKTGEVSPPGITCLTVDNGKWFNYSVL